MQDDASEARADRVGGLPTGTEGLPDAGRPEVVALADGDELHLEIAPVRKRIGDAVVRMLAYNGSVPGPTLRIPQDATVTVHVTNRGDFDATVHWHGLRLENRYDGTHETQAPIPVGETFTYRITVPDPGAYWYHPHIREDYGQELGLYGNILVDPADPEHWPPADRELLLTLDDVLIEDGRIAAFGESGPTHVAMGRFGNTMLVAGEPELTLDARRGEVVRLYLTNTANTRVFNAALPGARLKLVGADSGHYEREELVEEILLAPSERVVVDVLFDQPGELALEHRTPERTYRLATVAVADGPADPASAERFHALRTNPDMREARELATAALEAPPDKTLAFVAELDDVAPGEAHATGIHACPMHPELAASWPERCPTCGMKLAPAQAGAAPETPFACPMHAEIRAAWEATCPKCGMTLRAEHGGHHGHEAGRAAGTAPRIEWEDDMVEVNRLTTPATVRWKLVDRDSGAENAQIDWTFRVGDRVKLRLVNELDSDHPMPHPFHVHGAGRFLVLARDGLPEPNLAWKDTVLVRTGETVDILLEVTNPGRWMAHCHIAEHHEGGMMLGFDVLDDVAAAEEPARG
ncbi:MAG TPA: multicopper oxidase domain-containing protein [Gaiellaceae bacterium]|nr:multicopper oxidase domain-containing protein [Gaiellaceae bacterium]